MRLSIAAAIACLSIAGVAAGDRASAAIKTFTNIPAEGLGPALQTLAQAHDLQVVYLSEAIDNLKTSGAVGEFTAEEALKTLLKGTGLTYRYLDEKTVTVQPIPTGSSISSTGGEGRSSPSADAGSQDGSQLWERFRLAQANAGSAQRSSTVGSDVQSSSGSSENSPQLTEILVTAQKKTERLQDVPVPVSVLSGDALAQQNKLSLSDYANTVPGLVVAPISFGEQQIAIRGITTSGFTLPTVSATIDGVPYGGLLDIPDIDPGDLARVEVLRGPQGTLYGSSSMGGVVNFVMREPSLDGYSGYLETGTSVIQNGIGSGYNLRGAANVPVNETTAFRVSGYSYTDPGYIDDPVHNLGGVNRTEAYGGRASILFKPSDVFSLKFNTLYDHIDHEGSSEVDVPTAGYPSTAGLGDLQQNYIPGIGGQRYEVKAYSLTLNAKLWGNINLVSLTGYNDVYDPSTFDWSNAFGANAEKNFGVDGAANFSYGRYKKITEEVRLSSSIGNNFDWLLGGFYSHTHLYGYEVIAAEDPTTGRSVGADWVLIYPRTYEEAAAFANLTYRITDRLDIQIGGRESQDQERDAPETQEGPYVGATPSVSPAEASKDNAFTYLVTPRFKLSSDLMVYARLASGFRAGGPNQQGIGIPPAYAPDKTQNYEVGAKGNLFDKKLSIDGSLYYINWKDIQIQKFSAQNLTFTSNGSGAKSEGVEISVTVRPAEGLSISGWYTYDDAVLTQPFPVNTPLYGEPGDRLPLSSRNSGNLSVQQEFPVADNVTGFVGATEIFVGDRVGIFTSTALRQNLPAYEMTDLRAGINYGTWTTNIYVNNLTNERGLINGGLGYILPYALMYTTPRTVGLSVRKTF
jgi:iron complex outermembrane receptor protein